MARVRSGCSLSRIAEMFRVPQPVGGAEVGSGPVRCAPAGGAPMDDPSPPRRGTERHYRSPERSPRESWGRVSLFFRLRPSPVVIAQICLTRANIDRNWAGIAWIRAALRVAPTWAGIAPTSTNLCLTSTGSAPNSIGLGRAWLGIGTEPMPTIFWCFRPARPDSWTKLAREWAHSWRFRLSLVRVRHSAPRSSASPPKSPLPVVVGGTVQPPSSHGEVCGRRAAAPLIRCDDGAALRAPARLQIYAQPLADCRPLRSARGSALLRACARAHVLMR